MAISHGKSLHCTTQLYGKFVIISQRGTKDNEFNLNLAEMLPVRSCTNDAIYLQMCTQIRHQRHQLKFLIISHEHYAGEQFRTFSIICYNYKCMCFKLNIQWHRQAKNGCFLWQKGCMFCLESNKPHHICQYAFAQQQRQQILNDFEFKLH